MPSDGDWHRQIDGDPDLVAGLKPGAFHEGRLVGALLGVIRAWKPGRADLGYVKWLYVDPAFRRQGIAGALLEEAEDWFKSRGVQRLEYGASAPTYLLPGVWKGDAATRGLLESAGWTMPSERVSLHWPLDNVERDDVPLDGVEIQVCGEAALVEKVRRFIERTFSPSWARECAPALESRELARCQVALDAQTREVLGFAAVNTTNPNWFGPM